MLRECSSALWKEKLICDLPCLLVMIPKQDMRSTELQVTCLYQRRVTSPYCKTTMTPPEASPGKFLSGFNAWKKLTVTTSCISLEGLASISLANKKSSVTDQVFLFAQAARKLGAKSHPRSP